MDIFATQSLAASNLIETQFDNVLVGDKSRYWWFSPSLLNSSAADIQTAIENNTVPESTGYLFATLRASNATDPVANGPTDQPTTSSDPSGDSSGPSPANTSLAMRVHLCYVASFVLTGRCQDHPVCYHGMRLRPVLCCDHLRGASISCI